MDKELKKAKRTLRIDRVVMNLQGFIAMSGLLLGVFTDIAYDQKTYLLALGLFPMLLFIKFWGIVDYDKEKIKDIESKIAGGK